MNFKFYTWNNYQCAYKLHEGDSETNTAILHNGYRLSFRDRSAVDAEYVIIAIPFSVLRDVDIQVELEPKFRKFIQEVDLGKNEKVFAGFKNRVWLQEQGFTESAWSDLGFSQVWNATQRQPQKPNSVLTFFLGGKEVTAVKSESLSSLQQTFLKRFEKIIPQAKYATTGKFFRTNWNLDPLVRGSYTSFKPGQYTKFSEFLYVESEIPEENQEVSFGNLVFAGEHLSDEYYGYMNGAAQTRRLAAKAIGQI